MNCSNGHVISSIVEAKCPLHNNLIAKYKRGSKGEILCWCKRCKKEHLIVMGHEQE